MKKVLSLLLIVLTLFTTIFIAEATQSKSGNFIGGYTITGNGATDIVNIALKQEGRTGSQFGYTEQWCADFVSDCAKLAGQSSAVPFNGVTSTLKSAVITAGGFDTTSSPKAGDLCFIDWYGDGKIDHVEIVYDVSGSKVYTIGGNSGHPSTDNLYNRYVYKHTPINSTYNINNGIKISVVRPNYTTGHTHIYNNITSGPAYCDSQGFTRYTCSCGYSYTEYTPALGHDYSVCSYYESAHPHYAVYKCSRCEKTTVNYSEVSPNEECLTCPPVSAIDLVVTPGTSSTETVITWNPRPSLVSSYSEYYKFLLCIYDSNGKIVKMKEEPCKLTNIRPNVSFVLPSGYYTAELDTVKNNDYANAVSISTTFYVAQGETKYTLTYNANGGSGVPSSQTGSASYTVTSTKPTRNGYTFLGWSKSGNASYASYTAGDTITLTSDTTLYAVWQKNVTYYSCRYCGHSFTSESECNSHQLECNSKPTIAVPDVEYSYCPICGEKFENEIECDEHAVTCGQKTCINCGEIFANETEYNAHLANCRAQNGDDNSSTGIFGLIISFFANIFSIIIMVITLPFTLFF